MSEDRHQQRQQRIKAKVDARIAAAQPAISSVVSTLALFVESAARNAAFCVAVVSPLIISFITAYASL